MLEEDPLANNNDKDKKNKKKVKTVKLSTDPQSVAARQRRHRISDRFKILQSLVPGGTKMDTVSMLEEAIQYVKFLKAQLLIHQAMINCVDDDPFLFNNISVPVVPPPPTTQQILALHNDVVVQQPGQIGFSDYRRF
ncbi:hypothetical protein LguiA_016415 [Lonicera macranthoides]